MKQSIMALCLVAAQSICFGAPPSWLPKDRSEKTTLHGVAKISEREQQGPPSASIEGQTSGLDGAVTKQRFSPPSAIWPSEDSMLGKICHFLLKMEPLAPRGGCLGEDHPLKGLGKILSDLDSDKLSDVLDTLDERGKLGHLRFALETFPQRQKKLARSKYFYDFSVGLRNFLETCQARPERAIFELDKLSWEASAYQDLWLIEIRCTQNEEVRHRKRIEALLSAGKHRVFINCAEDFFFEKGRPISEAADFIEIAWSECIDATYESSIDSLLVEDLKKRFQQTLESLDTSESHLPTLKEHFMGWPTWARFAQSYANSKSCLEGESKEGSFTLKELKQYMDTK